MPEWIFRVRCYHCGKIQKISSRTEDIVGKRARCKSCGRGFSYFKSGFNNQIITERKYNELYNKIHNS